MRMAAALLTLALTTLWHAPGHAQEPASVGIDWEVTHRFRVVRAHRHDAFIADFNSYFQRAAEARGIDIPSGRRMAYPSPFRQNLPTEYDAESGQYRRGWFHNPTREIAVRLTNRADRNKTCRWRIGEGREMPAAPCGRRTLIETSLGRHDLAVRIGASEGPMDERRLPIEIKDLKIVALGDSFASGEGNPHVTFDRGSDNAAYLPRLAEWWDHRCHRSLLAASAQAGVMLAQQRRDTTVTYVSYACSGGTVRQGLIGGYDGVETAAQARDRLSFYGGNGDNIAHFRGTPLPIQIDQAAQLLCRPGMPCARPDVLIVTTGGNELDFGPKVRKCALGRCRFTRESMAAGFDALRQDFNALAPRLDALAGQHVLLMTYPNMMRRENGKDYCGDRPFDFRPDFVSPLAAFLAFGIGSAEAKSAERFVLDPLNALIADEAKRRGWTPVGGYSLKRGYCARPSWFHTVNQASAKQGEIGSIDPNGQFAGLFPSGAMHPNVFGHAGMRAELLKAIEARLPR